MAAVWDRREGESEAAFGHFAVYRDDPEKPRMLARTAEQRGISRKRIYEIAKMHDWEERVRAFDTWITAPALAVKQATLSDFETALNEHLQQKLVAVESIASEELRKLRERQTNGEDVDLLRLARLVRVINDADTLARRSASLPTVFTRQTSDKDGDGESDVYYVSMD